MLWSLWSDSGLYMTEKPGYCVVSHPVDFVPALEMGQAS